ncbi:putative RNase3 domain-containing protein [Rosellinia necatrix]|uniref:Dicer-like protein 1 n=1 Tax=Rosellinia necatrix TaxID=77044 RepID=A0A1S7UHP7_ROSNE|nr:putative RNase3 domain-containing protein [Rosellinia necatrix]
MDDHAHSEDEDSIHSDVPPQPATPTRLTQDKALFDDWLRNERKDAYKMGCEADIEDETPLLHASNSRGVGDALIISSPREYQTELFERAKQKNIIAVLDTGAGKTLIAALLLRHIVEQELDDRQAGKDHRLAFFLVDKVALVHQQYRVLETNLDFPMDSFTGESSAAIYTQEFWDQIRNEKTVVVCTAEILHRCLWHSFIRMEHVNLLIFDEAHHAKKNHPYARIIKDFYATFEKSHSKRPRILGMTASPVDAKTNVHTAAAQLEGLMHCEIATVDDPMVFSRAVINKPTEGFIGYFCTNVPFETVLWQRLHQIVGRNRVFDKLFTYSKQCTIELGRWAADRVWELWLTKEEAAKIEAKTELKFSQMEYGQCLDALDAEREAIEAIRQSSQLVKDHIFPALQLDEFHLSHKLNKLIEHLNEHFDTDIDNLSVRGYKAASLMGSGNAKSGDFGMSLAEQKSTIMKFRKSELNCLFATSAGEEGIDIPDCNIVIRFDLYKTVIQYIQSRGRARRIDSKFYQMVEVGNHAHRQLVADIQDHEAKLRSFCKTLPENRLITGCDYDIEYHLSKETSHRVYKVPSTGAMLTYRNSIAVLATFVSSLPHPVDIFRNNADYIIHNIGGEFQCEVILPDCSPIKSAAGRRRSSKQVAKCSAAFEMCLKLKKQKHLDDNLRSAFKKRLPAMRNARLAISSKKRNEYFMRQKPNAWSILGPVDRLFVTVIRLSDPKALGRPSRPLALLTRESLPRIASFPIYFGNQQMSSVECFPLSISLHCSLGEIDGLNNFTLRVFKDVFSKGYESEVENMPYFFAPLAYSHDSEHLMSDADPRAVIDWSCIHKIHNGPTTIAWENQPEDIFNDRFVIDPYDGSRKFYTTRTRPDLNSTDPQLPGLPRSRRGLISGEDSIDIWNSIVASLWRKSRGNLTRREDLPVVEAEYIPLRRNLLDQFDNTIDGTQRKCFLVFQTLKISVIPVDIVTMAYNLPAIIYRLESNLIVLEACNSIGLGLRPDLALEAMTKDSENTEDVAEDQINLQQGMGRNYERLEFLGDSFLKMATTVALFSQIQDCDEFQYHVDRMVLICNRNLFNNALEMKIEESIRTNGFTRSNWYPTGLKLLKGRIYSNKGRHSLADKTIADVCEALIGAAYMTMYDQKSFDMAVQAVTKFVSHPNHKMTAYNDYYAAYKIPDWQSSAPRAIHCCLANEIEQKMGYKFKYPRLLRSAFTHPSYGSIYEGIPNYQRLEFLGDALLDMLCVDYLFQRFPSADPQWLTEHKMAMVSNQFLGCLCVSLDLQKHMVSMAGGLQKEIADYVITITESRIRAEDDAEAAGLGRTAYARNYWMNEKRPPKSLPDIVESYIGALFVDSGFNFEEVQRFFDTHIIQYFENIHLYDTYAANHPVTLLSNMLATGFHCTKWRIMSSETDDEDREFGATKVAAGVMIHGAVRESVFAGDSRSAKQKVAQKFLYRVKSMTIGEFKQAFGCGCYQ